jgi:hypothetical protein
VFQRPWPRPSMPRPGVPYRAVRAAVTPKWGLSNSRRALTSLALPHLPCPLFVTHPPLVNHEPPKQRFLPPATFRLTTRPPDFDDLFDLELVLLPTNDVIDPRTASHSAQIALPYEESPDRAIDQSTPVAKPLAPRAANVTGTGHGGNKNPTGW